MNTCGLRIQPDWDKAILAKDEAFWFHICEPDATKFCKVKISPESYIPNVDNVSCRIISPKSICLEDKTRGLHSTFQCPDVTFTSIHKLQRRPNFHVNYFDVNNSGELALSAASDGAVFLWETATGDVRRQFTGHASEVYTCRFFPSGIVAVTGGSDMQLKIWSCLTGECAATLQPGTGGSDPTCKGQQPGGHHSGVIDVDFIDRGRNIVSLDRGGWLRLWDVSSQLAISAISVVPNIDSTSVNCDLSQTPTCCVVKQKTCNLATPEKELAEVLKDQSFCVLETSSSQPVAYGVTDKIVAVCTASRGILSIIDISSPNSRSQGPVLQLSLPSKSGSVTACSFSETEEFGVVAGGESGEIACWDLRNPREPLLAFTAAKSGITKLQTYHRPSCNVTLSNGDIESLPDFTGLFVAYRDGRTTLQSLLPSTKDNINRSVLELTGPDIDPIRGLCLIPSKISSQTVTVWTGTNGAHFHCYRNLAIDSLFS